MKLTPSERYILERDARRMQREAEWHAKRARELREEDPCGWIANIRVEQTQAREYALHANILVRVLLGC